MQHANWIAQAREHWKEHQPKRFARLKKEGKLEQALTDAADQTARSMRVLQEQGFPHQDAWEMTREQYLFPPEEKRPEPRGKGSLGYQIFMEHQKFLSEFDPNKED